MSEPYRVEIHDLREMGIGSDQGTALTRILNEYHAEGLRVVSVLPLWAPDGHTLKVLVVLSGRTEN